MELRNSLPKLPMVQNAMISSFRQLSHTPKYLNHCLIHLQFLREKYILFRIMSAKDSNRRSFELPMDTKSSYVNPYVLSYIIEENYRGFEWNIFWMHHLQMLLKTMIRSLVVYERKKKKLADINTTTTNESDNVDTNIENVKNSSLTIGEEKLKENLEEISNLIDYLISGGVIFTNEMKTLIESTQSNESKKWLYGLLRQQVQQGCNNWDLKLLNTSQMQNVFPNITIDSFTNPLEIPMDIIKFIFTFVTL